MIVVAIGRYFDTENGELGFKTKYFASENEKEVLENFRIMLEKQDPVNTVSVPSNGKEFDFPYLCRRMLINDMMPPALLNQTGRISPGTSLISTPWTCGSSATSKNKKITRRSTCWLRCSNIETSKE